MTIAQKKHFFGLLDQLGYDKKEMADRAVARFGASEFSLITSPQISELIAILEKELAETTLEPTIQKETPKGDFPNWFRVWDRMMREMSEDQDAPDVLFLKNEEDMNRFHVMQWTGRKDDTGKKIFDFDYIESSVGKKYLVQWSWKECAWVAYDDDNVSMYLSSFGKVTVIGNVYSEVVPV